MRLIDADAGADVLQRMARNYHALGMPADGEGYATMARMLKNTACFPTIDAVPVVHAHWEEETVRFRCSRCRTLFSDEIMFINCIDEYMPKYCPECGARMDGGAE